MMILHKNTDPRNLMWLPIGRRGKHISSNGCFSVYMRGFVCYCCLMSAPALYEGVRPILLRMKQWFWCVLSWGRGGNMIIVTKRIMKSSEHLLAAGAHFVDNNLEQSRCLGNVLNLSRRSGLRKIHPTLTFKMSSLPCGLIFAESCWYFSFLETFGCMKELLVHCWCESLIMETVY